MACPSRALNRFVALPLRSCGAPKGAGFCSLPMRVVWHSPCGVALRLRVLEFVSLPMRSEVALPLRSCVSPLLPSSGNCSVWSASRAQALGSKPSPGATPLYPSTGSPPYGVLAGPRPLVREIDFGGLPSRGSQYPLSWISTPT